MSNCLCLLPRPCISSQKFSPGKNPCICLPASPQVGQAERLGEGRTGLLPNSDVTVPLLGRAGLDSASSTPSLVSQQAPGREVYEPNHLGISQAACLVGVPSSAPPVLLVGGRFLSSPADSLHVSPLQISGIPEGPAGILLTEKSSHPHSSTAPSGTGMMGGCQPAGPSSFGIMIV